MSVTLVRRRRARVLDLDLECRPLSWYGGDWVSKEVTAIAWAWVSPSNPARIAGPVNCVLLSAVEPEAMIETFREAYDAADVVTGHYLRGFDLPLLNGAALELGLPPLTTKLVQDTKLDLVRFAGLSKSQESLAAMLGLRHRLRHPKVRMTQEDWRAANRLTPDGLERTQRRVTGDVRQHVELRAALLDRGMLGPPRPWTGSSRLEEYQP